MEIGISTMNRLNLGVYMQVKYDPAKKQQVTVDDEIQAILKRYPQIIKKAATSMHSVSIVLASIKTNTGLQPTLGSLLVLEGQE